MRPYSIDVIQLSCVSGPQEELKDGLVGPGRRRPGAELSWTSTRADTDQGLKKTSLTATRHPAVYLLDFGHLSHPLRDQEIQEKVKMFQRAPQSWAFMAGEAAKEDDEESDSSEADEEQG